MSSSKLTITRKKSPYGTTITIANKDKSFKHVVIEDLNFDPLKNNDAKFDTGGYLFRSPDIHIDDLAVTLKTFSNMEGRFNLTSRLTKKSDRVDALIRIEEKSDAAIFGWSNVEVWQKWSEAQQTEAEAEAKKKPQKVKLNKDGTVTITVTSTTLADIED